MAAAVVLAVVLSRRRRARPPVESEERRRPIASCSRTPVPSVAPADRAAPAAVAARTTRTQPAAAAPPRRRCRAGRAQPGTPRSAQARAAAAHRRGPRRAPRLTPALNASSAAPAESRDYRIVIPPLTIEPLAPLQAHKENVSDETASHARARAAFALASTAIVRTQDKPAAAPHRKHRRRDATSR